MSGKFIVLEGLDGSGKSTVIQKLKKEFPRFVYTREPGGSEFGEMVRKVLLDPRSANVPALAMLLGFMSARASHFEELVISRLKEGRVVVSDRFDASTYAFQLHGQQNLDLEDLFWYLREEIVVNEDGRRFRPHYFYLRMSKEVAAARRENRSQAAGAETHFDLQTPDYHQRVFEGYEAFFEHIDALASNMISPSENNVKVIDASVSPEEVYRKTREALVEEISSLV